MFAGFRSQGYHIIDHGSNILYLGINISCHFLRGGCPGLQLAVMVGQFVHSVYDNVRTMFVSVASSRTTVIPSMMVLLAV